ncbi:MAG: AAA family ATPase [Prevotella sp.]|nr:AAA family ATPase [Prevotella sp.]
MAKQSVYKLDGKSPEEMKQSFVHYMGDKNATSKQIKDAANSRYVKIDTNSVVLSICKKLYSVDNIYKIADAGRVSIISDELTTLINAGGDEGEIKELKNTRSYVNKYRDFLTYCANLSEEALDSTTPYDFADDPEKPFIAEDIFNEIVELLFRKKNIILQGAPGVGKTFLAKKIAYQLIGMKKNENIEIVQFHQSYSYEDFIQGIRPTTTGEFKVRNGIFYNFCENAKEHPEDTFVFIIDEINRGNLSKIFGELMMLIEYDKRSPRYALKLTYNEGNSSRFYVPENVYLIGCMNTADRSIAIVDYALRRRFAFCEVEPEFGDTFKNYLGTALSNSFVNEICRKVNRVNDIIRTSTSLGKGLEIGHSYFCQLSSVDDEQEWYKSICKYELFPYLREICFDNEELFGELCHILSD